MATATETMDNGTVKTQYNYTPFGKTEILGEQSDNPFMFTGREWDGATGLYYFRNRYQSPILGRFISEDPIGLAGGINFYSYVGNNPINRIDPLGLWYTDINVNLGFIFGITFGVMMTPEGVYAYYGTGFMTNPGASVTIAPFNDPSPGENDAFQLGSGVGIQAGVSTKTEGGCKKADEIFFEIGLASPGTALVGYNVLELLEWGF